MIYFENCETEKKFMGKYEIEALTLDDFLRAIDNDYQQAVHKVDLFNPNLTAQWTQEQKTLFVRLFYHARGHFYKFLWYVGSLSQDKKLRENALHNIGEEFGEKGKSHEQMYLDFADSLGVDLIKEIHEEKFYLNFLREFNRKHIQLILEGDDIEKLCLFSAYERLDNVDYPNLLELVKNIGVVEKEALLFFIVHSHAEHFDQLYDQISTIWAERKEDIISAFHLIYDNQLLMWKKLSMAIQARICETS